jgi:hypothetical protein
MDGVDPRAWAFLAAIAGVVAYVVVRRQMRLKRWHRVALARGPVHANRVVGPRPR